MKNKRSALKKHNKLVCIKPVLLLGFVLISYCGFGQLTEKHFKIYSAKESKEVSIDAIVLDAQNYDVVFFGEEHNDSVAHYLQNRLFMALFQKYGNTIAISMEMFDRDVQHIMDEYLQDRIREVNFVKDARVWGNYKDYKPMVEFAKKNKLDVICANAPRRYTNLAGRKGQQALMELPKETKKYFAPLPYDTASGEYYKKLMELTQFQGPSHDTSRTTRTMPARMGSFNMVLSQSLWDATMGFSIADYLKKHKGKKVLHLNGRFHSDEGLAAVTQLKKYRPKTRVLVISANPEKEFEKPEWKKHVKRGDYIILTDPNVPRSY
jgi:uncharacterized iron-regulated protein